MQNIIVLGGNYAGIGIAHHLLRHTLPLLNSTNSAEKYKLTLVSYSDHTYFNVAAPRALAAPEKVPLDKIFIPISTAFGSYKSSEFTFVHGEAVGIDENARTVSVKEVGTAETNSLPYAVLVVATGTCANILFTLHGEHSNTIAAFHDMHARLPKAKSVVIAGGGPTGVEVAAEMAFFHPEKDVTLLSGTSRLLNRVQNTSISPKAEKKLAALDVKTIHNVRVTAANKTKDENKTTLEFSDGSTRVVDIYLDATGGKPNSGFLPTSWLDTTTNRVVTNGETLRATQAPAGVYALGDVASYSKCGIPDASWPVAALAYSIWYDIQTGKISSASSEKSEQSSSRSGANLSAIKEKKYKQIKSDMIIVPTGPKGGVGAIFGWSIPSWLVWLLIARTFGVERVPKWAAGL